MIRVKNVIERKSDDRVIGVKRAVKSSADARVKQTADLLKKFGRARPRDIVQIAANDGRQIVLVGNAPDHQQFGIAFEPPDVNRGV